MLLLLPKDQPDLQEENPHDQESSRKKLRYVCLSQINILIFE